MISTLQRFLIDFCHSVSLSYFLPFCVGHERAKSAPGIEMWLNTRTEISEFPLIAGIWTAIETAIRD